MSVAKKQCKSCPFRGISESERRELAVIPADEWPCHTLAPLGDGPQCRGHYQARRKYPSTDEDLAKLRKWQKEENEKLIASVEAS